MQSAAMRISAFSKNGALLGTSLNWIDQFLNPFGISTSFFEFWGGRGVPVFRCVVIAPSLNGSASLSSIMNSPSRAFF